MGFLKVGLARGVFFHAGKIKSTNSTGPLETEQWVNVTLDTMGMYVFSIYQNKVVQRHASLLNSRENNFREKNENHQQTPGLLRNQNPTNRGSFGMNLVPRK